MRRPSFYDPRLRAIVYQAALAIALVGAAFFFYYVITGNLRRLGITSGFGFLEREGGFALSQTLIDFDERSTYLRAFTTALLNTLLVSALSIVTATALGCFIGLARVSRSRMLSVLAGAYVEFNRNIPLLLHLLFWYYIVIGSLPVVRQSLSIGGAVILNNRGLVVARPEIFGFAWLIALAVAATLAWAFARWARRRRNATGRGAPVSIVGLALLIGLPALTILVGDEPVKWDFPALRGLSYHGGITLQPELVALWFALTIYHSAFIAEIVRAGLQSVDRVQFEASMALSFTRLRAMRLIVFPQAMRVIIPPLGNNLLSIVKDTSLGAAIGYPDLMQVFWGTVLFQTGQGIEVTVLTMGSYLAISLVVSGLINIYNRAYAIPGRH